MTEQMDRSPIRSRSRSVPSASRLVAATASQISIDNTSDERSYVQSAAEDRAQQLDKLSPVQQAWGDWLRLRSYDWFVTLTFIDPIHPEQAEKRFRRWISVIERHPARSHHGPCRWVASWERQRRGVLHAHGLIADVGGIPYTAAGAIWHQVGRGYALIRPYDPERGAAYYLAKQGDIAFSDGGAHSTPDTAQGSSSHHTCTPAATTPQRDTGGTAAMEELVIAVFDDLGIVNGATVRLRLVKRRGELLFDIRKVRNDSFMPQGIELTLEMLTRLLVQKDRLLGAMDDAPATAKSHTTPRLNRTARSSQRQRATPVA